MELGRYTFQRQLGHHTQEVSLRDYVLRGGCNSKLRLTFAIRDLRENVPRSSEMTDT